MSNQTMSDLLMSTEAHYRVKVIEDTWGHLAPRKNKLYPGYIIYAIAFNGLYCLINYDFTGLDDSPWLFDALQGFIGDNTKEEGKVYRFDGTFRNFEFNGTVKEISCQ